MIRALAAFATVLAILAKARMTFPSALIAVAALVAACLALAWLIATGIGRLAESGPYYRTTRATEGRPGYAAA